MKRALVLDSNQRSALAVTRSLGKQGVPVFTTEETAPALAGASRYSRQHFTCPSPAQEPKKFIEYLTGLVSRLQIDILLPMTELTTTLLLLNQEAFPSTLIPFADANTVDALANKCHLMQTAGSLDIPVPLTWYADNASNLPDKLENLPYPLVLKPGKSWVFYNNQWRRAAVKFAQTPAEAQNIIDTYWAFQTLPFMLQASVEGHGAGVFAIYDHGRPLAFFAHKRLREKPPSGGVSVLSESVAVDPVQGIYARKLLDNAAWHGVAMVEFKVTPDGTPYLMEINTRFWGSLQLSIDSGVDFPWLLYQVSCGEQANAVTDYKTENRLRWLLGDLDSLYLTFKNRQAPVGKKLVALLRFLTPSPLRTRHEINRIGDMGPFWYELRQYMRDILGKS